MQMLSNLSIEEQDVLYYIYKKGYMIFTNPTDFDSSANGPQEELKNMT